MKPGRLLYGLLLVLLPAISLAQGPGKDPDQVPQAPSLQSVRLDAAPFILDDSHTNTGQEFYDLFYKQWNLTTPTDTAQLRILAQLFAASDVIITIQEPTMARVGPMQLLNTASTQILIGINGQPIWHQFVQGQSEEFEMAVLNAVEVVWQRLISNAISYEEIKQLLGSPDQKSTDVH